MTESDVEDGMTIDKSIGILVDRYIDTYVVCGGENYNPAINIIRQDYEAFQVAIHTMRKYQKQQKVLDEIRAEIIQVIAKEKTEDLRWALGLKYSIKIFDKHKAEIEP